MGSVFTASCCGVRLWSLAALCLLLIVSNRPALAQNYSCGNASSGHCYGVASWQEQPQYYGAYTELFQENMNCPSGCGGFIDNEIWLEDTQTAACVANPFGECWVEAGFIALDGDGNPNYFWADSRPMNSNTFNFHLLNQADLSDTDYFMIIQDARGAAGIYQVWIYNNSQGTFFNGTSTSNTMSANIIDIGSELGGTNGANAELGIYSMNIWAVQPLGSDFTFWYNSQIDDGNLTIQSPHTVLWLLDASPGATPVGGIFITECCQ